MLTRTQTKHQVINHIHGCNHDTNDFIVQKSTDIIMTKRQQGERITTALLCNTIEEVETINKGLNQ